MATGPKILNVKNTFQILMTPFECKALKTMLLHQFIYYFFFKIQPSRIYVKWKVRPKGTNRQSCSTLVKGCHCLFHKTLLFKTHCTIYSNKEYSWVDKLKYIIIFWLKKYVSNISKQNPKVSLKSVCDTSWVFLVSFEENLNLFICTDLFNFLYNFG